MYTYRIIARASFLTLVIMMILELLNILGSRLLNFNIYCYGQRVKCCRSQVERMFYERMLNFVLLCKI